MTETASAPARTFFGHPFGLVVLFLTEMWERFSYYGMRSLLPLYMVKRVLQPENSASVWFLDPFRHVLESAFGPLSIQATASQIYGLYIALVFLTPLAGGFIADRFLGSRRTLILGALTMSAGHFMMASEPLFLLALVMLIVGNGLFKGNCSTQVGRLYRPGDSRRDRAYSIFYVGINVGAFLSPLVCGTLGEEWGWDWGFGAAGLGMAVSTLFYIAGWRQLPPDRVANRPGETLKPIEGPPSREDLRAVLGIVILFLLTPFFWAAFEQQGNVIAIYADSELDRHVWLFGFDWEFPTSWVQSINPLFIFLLTPILNVLWAWQEERGTEPGGIAKIAMGAIMAGSSYFVLCLAAQTVGAGEKSSWLWLMPHFAILTLGELYLSPIGLSVTSKASPARYAGLLMGWCFIANFIGNYLTGFLGGYWEAMSHTDFFLLMGGIAILAGAVIAVVRRPLTRLMNVPGL